VRDHDDRLAARPDGALQERQELSAGTRVQRTGRLVGEDDLRLAGECPCGGDALLLPARQLCRPVTEPLGEADRLDDGADPQGVRSTAAMRIGSSMFSCAVKVGAG
jgi:hypothetical protein